jgi:hypothetical protein
MDASSGERASGSFATVDVALAANDAAWVELSCGFSALEVELLRQQHLRASAGVLVKNLDLVEVVASRTWRVLTELWVSVCRELAALGVPVSEIRGVKRALEYPVSGFAWSLSRVERPGAHYLGGGGDLAVDVLWFLTQIEGKALRSGAGLPFDLVERYLLRCAFERLDHVDASRSRSLLSSLFGDRGRPSLDVALGAFLRFKRRDRGHDESPLSFPDTGAAACSEVGAGPRADAHRASDAWQLWEEERQGHARAPVHSLSALGLTASGGVGLPRALESASRLLLLLLGVPPELPVPWLGGDAAVLRNRARWLAGFLLEKPRGNNTPGSHVACGLIAVKRTLKALALRRERRDSALSERVARRAWLAKERNRAAQRVYASLVAEAAGAVEHSRREHAYHLELTRLDEELLARRLSIQACVVDEFTSAWEEARRLGLVSDDLHARALAELQQPPGQPPALLPLGLVRSRAVWLFEYGMLLGRVAFALAFVVTFQQSYLVLGVLLFALNLYVVEPVLFKLHMGLLGGSKAPGHKMTDLRRHLQSELPEGGVFRLPITVPKYSSNPAWANLNAIIQAALTRSLTTDFTLTPLAMRHGQNFATIELRDGAEADVSARASRLCDVLRSELGAARAKFPLRAEVSARGRCVTVTLTDSEEAIWALIGEDASQAFIYLWRNLRALADTLSHLGGKLQPVFILASNTEDPDVIEYELSEIQKLQAWSEREYRGQVGFLYLLRGGEWSSYNSRLERFDAKDKTFAKATPHFKERLKDPATPAREHLLGTIIDALEPKQIEAVFNATLEDESFYRAFDAFRFDELPAHRSPAAETLALLARKRAGQALGAGELTTLNRELLLTALPMRVRGAFFKKVGNDLAVQELLVAGKTKPTSYIDRRVQEHVQDPERPNYSRVWGDFARYTGLAGTSEQIQEAILEGRDIPVESVPELGAILDDKNEFAPGEIEKGLATLLHPENRHIVIGVPRIDVTLPEHEGQTVASEYILAAQAARAAHNAQDGLTRARVYSYASAAYGKWFERPEPYLAHYARESLNAAHALSHDFQQSYLVAGAGGRLAGFTEALYGPERFEVRAAPEPEAAVEGSRARERRGLRAACGRLVAPLRARRPAR